MNWELYLAFCLATGILIIIPGPAVSMIVANSLSHGVRAALITVAGSSCALSLQLTVVAFGMTSIMVFLAESFEVLRWIGVAYLLYLGIKSWRARAMTLEELETLYVPPRKLFFQGLFVNSTNPKTLFFNAAFFPQFLDPSLPIAPQLVLLCSSFLIIATVLDSGYAVLAGRLRHTLRSKRAALIRNRVTGTLLAGAGIGLALARKS